MCQEKLRAVREKVLYLQAFLEPYKCLVNAHMTSFITNNCWDLLPEEIRIEAASLSADDLQERFWNWGSDSRDFQVPRAVGEFFDNCQKSSLSSETFNDILLFQDKEKFEDVCKGPAKCMSPKKTHEVRNLKEIVGYLCREGKANCVVDVGGGKGYLGSSLVLEKKIQVLSIDSKSHNTNGAVKIFGKIEKYQGSSHSSSPSYKHATAFVTAATSLQKIAEENLGTDKEYKICLTGLHVCGDLASTCINLFLQSHSVLSVCTIACCYNLLTEKFEMDKNNIDTSVSQDEFGFPLSELLADQRYVLGRNARMIACQSIERICHEKKKMNSSLFWRAVLQVHLQRLFGLDCDLAVGRSCSKATCITDYFHRAEKSLKKNLQMITEEDIMKLAAETQHHHDSMVKFYYFRLALAPVVEALLLMDKLLFLLENGVENAYLSKVFDSIMSPRCYAIIAVKNESNGFNNSKS